MSESLFLGLLETSGNQAYIFATNRLRENVGASQRVWQAGVEFTYRAAQEVSGCTGFDTLRKKAKRGPVSYAKAMRKAPRLSEKVAIEVVVATSGKALFLAREEEKAKELIAYATRMALEEAPGLTIRGAIVPIEGNDASTANAAVKAVHEEIEAIRDHLPAPEIRFPTLPILEPCASSGLPAAEVPSRETYGSDPKPSSDVTIAKRAAHQSAVKRISKLIGLKPKDLGKNIGEMEKNTDWIGIVHADGNGMGQLFLEFGEICTERKKTKLRDYFDDYRELSLSLDLCGVAAFQAALKEVYPASAEDDQDSAAPDRDTSGAPPQGRKPGQRGKKERLPLLPLVLGGDDLTVLCDGRMAVRFAAAYLEAFQEQTTKAEVLGRCSSLPGILEAKRCIERNKRPHDENQPGTDEWSSLGAAAGIAVTKPHYPFHRGYELAESLLREAKTAKTKLGVSRCALDFHVLFDGAETSLDDLRERWTLPTGHRLTARPYVLARPAAPNNAGEDENAADAADSEASVPKRTTDDDNPWSRHRGWEDLRAATRALVEVGSGARKESGLPRSQQYALRTALFRGADAADRHLALIRHRYPSFLWNVVVHEAEGRSPSLFFPVDQPSGDKELLASRLLDALELADLGATDPETEGVR